MRLIHRFLISSFIFTLLMCYNTSYSQDKTLEWKLFHTVKKGWIPAGNSGSVQEILIRTKELPDPFVGTNEKQFEWIESYDWMFESVLEITPEDTSYAYLELFFPAIDTYATIFINDSLVLQAENAFRPYTVQAKKWLHVGKNKIRAIFKTPINYHRKAFNALAAKYPAPNDVGEIAVSSMSRKPQYQFGWDWALRMNTIGFMKPVRLLRYSTNRIRAAKIETKKIDNEQAVVELAVEFQLRSVKSVHLKSKLFGDFPDVTVKEGTLKLPLVLKNPTLWWPNGQGDAFLYEDQLTIEFPDQTVLSTTLKFGIRTSELIQEKDKWGTSFYLKINNRPVFCKGANYIPQEIFPTKITDESIQDLVQQMKNSNFNIVRVWGGGMYPEDAFLEACDRAGIMIWEDFMFACAMYPGDDHFLTNVQSELNFQIPRLSAHPSVVLLNGNNEVDVAWKNWGFQTQYKISSIQQKEIESAYQKLFQQMIPLSVKSRCFVPYVHTSPLSNWGKDEYYKHGSQHYWGVWHGKDPMEDFAFKSGRFNAEYGFQSFPTLSTIAKFSQKEDWKLDSEVMKWHQKSYVGNGMIQKHADLLFGPSASFEEFIYFSQLTQAKAVGLAISSHRIGSPRCMGSIYWQLNDCWPAPTWSSIDYYGNWKALQYEVQKDFDAITVVESITQSKSKVFYLVSDLPKNEDVRVKTVIFSLEGKIIQSDTISMNLLAGKSIQLMSEKVLDSVRKMNCLLQFEWEFGNKKGIRSFANLELKRTKPAKSSVKWTLTEVDLMSKTAVILIENKTFIADCWIASKKNGIHFDTNFESYLPGIHSVKIHFTDLPQQADFELQWR